MLSDLEAQASGQRRRQMVRAAEAAGIYLLVAFALLVELALVALHPENDAVLLIGVILLTLALAIWLRFLLIIPAVVLVWLVPPSVRDAVLGDEPWRWDYAAVLAGQLYLACATRVAYRALRIRMLGAHEDTLIEFDTQDTVVDVAPEPASQIATAQSAMASPTMPLEDAPPPLPCGRVLAPAEAAALLAQLRDLRRELNKSGVPIRTLLERSLELERAYRDRSQLA